MNEWSYTSASPIRLRAVDRDDSARRYVKRNFQENNYCFPHVTQKGKLRLVTCHEGPEGEEIYIYIYILYIYIYTLYIYIYSSSLSLTLWP